MGAILLCLAGCATYAPQHIAALAPIPGPMPSQVTEIAPVSHQSSVPAGPLTLEQLAALALERHPALAAAYAKVEAARGKLVQAGLYPNPTLGWEADELGAKLNGAGEQGPFIEQEIVTGRKLDLARLAAAQGVAIADWQAITRRFEVLTRVRLAYFDYLAARVESAALKRILDQVEKEQDGRRGFLQITRSFEEPLGFKSERLRVEVEIAELNVRLQAAREKEHAALRRLGTAVGMPELTAAQVDAGPALWDAAVPGYKYDDALRGLLARSSELGEAQARVIKAQQDLLLAQAERLPNMHVRVHPFRAFPEEDNRLQVEAGIPLPIFNANQGNILAAQAEVLQSFAEARHTELRLVERLSEFYQRYRTASDQVSAYKTVVEKSEESFNLAWALYDKARAEELRSAFTSALDAYRNLAQARLAYVQAQADLRRAAVELKGLLQEER